MTLETCDTVCLRRANLASQKLNAYPVDSGLRKSAIDCGGLVAPIPSKV